MTTPSIADSYFTIPELMRVARGSYKRAVDDQELERRLTGAELAGLRRGLAVLGEIKQSLAGPVLRRGLPQ
jgi:hypothetical protein